MSRVLTLGDAFQARATHASHRAALRRLGLSVGIAIALMGCARNGTINEDGECIYIPTGERYVVKAGTQALVSGVNFGFDARGEDGFTRRVSSDDAEHWKCRSAGGKQ